MPDELAFVKSFKVDELRVDPGTSFLREGSQSEHLYTVLSGWAFRYKMLDDGRRQILNYALPADIVGLQGAVMREMEHSVEALTPLTLCVFPRVKLWELYGHFPSLAFDMTWLAAREEQLIDENLVSLGRRTALERIAYLLLHLYTRAEEAGLTKDSFPSRSNISPTRSACRSYTPTRHSDACWPPRRCAGITGCSSS
jgi:CRP-like cAMP-binding protein